MYGVLVFLSLTATVLGVQRDGLRVKFGLTGALENKEYFYDIPRTIMEAESKGWRRTNRDSDELKDLRLLCKSDRGICPLYDVGGFVAGIQVAIPVEDYEPSPIKPEKRFKRWKAAPIIPGEPTKEYWTATQYFVSEESLKAGAGPQIENGATLQDGGVWVHGLDGNLMRIPTTENEIRNTLYKKQNCIPNMGLHYYYNTTYEQPCETWVPWFGLISEGELVGVGFQFFGKVKTTSQSSWFEGSGSFKKIISLGFHVTVPRGPPCLFDWISEYGFISVHIYYVNKPWEIVCRDGDSVKQPSLIDRITITGHRYASYIVDGFKNIFNL